MNPMNPPDDQQFAEQWLDERADWLCRRSARRVAREWAWNRRLRLVNALLLAAVILLSVQVGWGLVLLAQLRATVAHSAEITRLLCS